MATIQQLRAEAQIIHDEKQIGGNTAERIGDTFMTAADIIEQLGNESHAAVEAAQQAAESAEASQQASDASAASAASSAASSAAAQDSADIARAQANIARVQATAAATSAATAESAATEAAAEAVNASASASQAQQSAESAASDADRAVSEAQAATSIANTADEKAMDALTRAGNAETAAQDLNTRLNGTVIPVIAEAMLYLYNENKALRELLSGKDNAVLPVVKAQSVECDDLLTLGVPNVLYSSVAGAPSAANVPDNWDEATMTVWNGCPRKIGQQYVDKVSKKVYYAVAVTDSTSDWVVLN